VTNTVPFPGGTTTSTACNQGGSPVTTLSTKGTATDNCTGSVNETAPACNPSADTFYSDKITATGTDTANNTPISGGTSNSVKIFRCQNTTGLSISKTCPSDPLAPGTPFSCTFSVTNLDPANTVINLSVTNTVPFPGGTTTSTVCNQGGSPVTTLGAKGTATDTCTGAVNEVAPPCGSSTIFYQDKVAANGIDTGINSPVSASTTNSVRVLACTPTPTPTLPNCGTCALGYPVVGNTGRPGVAFNESEV